MEADPSRFLFVPERFLGEADVADQESVVVHPVRSLNSAAGHVTDTLSACPAFPPVLPFPGHFVKFDKIWLFIDFSGAAQKGLF